MQAVAQVTTHLEEDKVIKIMRSAPFVKFALVVYPRFLRGAELGTKGTVVSMTLHMNSFNMFPKTSLVLGRP